MDDEEDVSPLSSYLLLFITDEFFFLIFFGFKNSKKTLALNVRVSFELKLEMLRLRERSDGCADGERFSIDQQ